MNHLPVLLAVLFAGCATESAPYDLEIRGDSIAFGGDLHVGLLESDGDELIDGEWFPFERPVTYGGILDAGARYQLHMFYDRDGDGVCSSPPRDYVWKIELREIEAPASVDLDAIGQAAAGCAYFAR